MTTCLEAALDYAKRGWHVLPVWGITGNACDCPNSATCGSCGKHPILTNGLDGATTNETIIRNWWRVHPNANVAIRTGAVSGIVVLDFDGPIGLKTADTLSTGPTPRSITGSGGRHWICAHPGFDVHNATKKLPGMDVRGERGYIVAPPSMHACGNPYRWEEYLSPNETDPAPLPGVVLEALAPEDKAKAVEDVTSRGPAEPYTVGRARRYIEKMRPGVSGDGGHQATFKAALAAVKGFGLDRAQALEVMREYNARCVPPWTDDELEHKVDSALASTRVGDGYIVKRDEGVGTAVRVADANWQATVTMAHNRQFGRSMPVPDLTNAAIFLRNCEPYAGRLRYDAFADRAQINDGDKWRELTDVDVLVATVWLQKLEQDCRVTDEMTRKAMTLVVHENPHHPVREYLSALTWDGLPRIEDWLIRLGGSPDTRYTRVVSARWLIAAVARIMRPGERADTVLILEGAQGTRKSTAVSVLGGKWSSAMANGSLGSKDALEQLRGRWIVEMAELDAMTKAEVSTAKDFISRTSDYYRPSYGHFAKNFPRECVFAGTVNHDSYLRDETGGRRFWPVPIKSIDTVALAAERDQLWAEAVAKFQEGVQWWLGAEDEVLAAEEQEQRQVTDSWEETVARWLDGQVEAVGPLAIDTVNVSIGDILSKALEAPIERHGRREQTRVGSILTHLGWKKYRAAAGEKRMTR